MKNEGGSHDFTMERLEKIMIPIPIAKYFKENHPFVLLNYKPKCAKICNVNSHMYGDAEPKRPYMAATNVLVME